MGKRRSGRGRDIHGILLLNKPSGLTSNEALQVAKRLYQARKAGHTGSLDKLASGLLPLCFGEATKFSSYLLDADKRYKATCRLGIKTSTGDAAGDIISEQAVPELKEQDIKEVLASFLGESMQVPPMYSALKHKGQRLYQLAYQGIEVEREPRPIHIYHLSLNGFTGETFVIDVHCSKGTYIRTLVEDIGQKLGCDAHVSELHRTASGPFNEDEMVNLDVLAALAEKGSRELDDKLLDIDAMIRELPEVVLTDSVAYYLKQGQPVMVPRAPTEGTLRIYNENHSFLGVGEILDDGRVAPRRLVNF